jgi:hypothetical protein
MRLIESPLENPKSKVTALFERLLARRNDVGLLSEEYDPQHYSIEQLRRPI